MAQFTLEYKRENDATNMHRNCHLEALIMSQKRELSFLIFLSFFFSFFVWEGLGGGGRGCVLMLGMI